MFDIIVILAKSFMSTFRIRSAQLAQALVVKAKRSEKTEVPEAVFASPFGGTRFCFSELAVGFGNREDVVGAGADELLSMSTDTSLLSTFVTSKNEWDLAVVAEGAGLAQRKSNRCSWVVPFAAPLALPLSNGISMELE